MYDFISVFNCESPVMLASAVWSQYTLESLKDNRRQTDRRIIMTIADRTMPCELQRSAKNRMGQI